MPRAHLDDADFRVMHHIPRCDGTHEDEQQGENSRPQRTHRATAVPWLPVLDIPWYRPCEVVPGSTVEGAHSRDKDPISSPRMPLGSSWMMK